MGPVVKGNMSGGLLCSIHGPSLYILSDVNFYNDIMDKRGSGTAFTDSFFMRNGKFDKSWEVASLKILLIDLTAENVIALPNFININFSLTERRCKFMRSRN